MFAFDFNEMSASDQVDVLGLIGRAMNLDELEYARQTFDFHFACLSAKGKFAVESNRIFYIAKHHTEIKGVIGLHQYRWGPSENIWLSWFAVEPEWQGQGIGQWMLKKIQNLAVQQGYKKLFIETYGHDTFSRALKFYQKQGFLPAGQIENYLTDGSDMLVLVKALS